MNPLTTKGPLSRRTFLAVGSAAGAGLLIGFHLPLGGRTDLATLLSDTGAADGAADLNAWIRIAPDDAVTLFINESEMGQGVLTSLAMILAEELDADWAKVRSEEAPTDFAKYGRQSTGGSSSVRGDYAGLRKAGAAARAMLIQAAAETWGVPTASCHADAGTVLHATSGRRLRYGELADRAARLTPPANPPLKDRKDFRIVGKPTKRLDSEAKVTGRATFGIDVRTPGMLVAQVVHPPVFGATLKSFDASKARRVPGVRDVVEIPTGVAIVADHFWAATQGRDALTVTWDDGPAATLTTEQLFARCKEIVGKGVDARKDGDADAALATAAKQITAVYEAPFLAHAPMEPLNCAADVRTDRCEVWAPTQSPTSARQIAARITGLPEAQVTVHTTFLGGGFGRRAENDFVADAVHVSKAVGKPVRVQWTREDDMHGGWYRPMAYNELAGALGPDGWPTAFRCRVAGPSIFARFGPFRNGYDPSTVEGLENLPYAIPSVHVTAAQLQTAVTVLWWRSVGNSQNGWVAESFIDELAALAGKDPYEFRRHLLADKPRHLRVLETAATKAGWGTPLPTGRARGIAVVDSFGSYVAEVAEVSLAPDGAPRVHKVVCAVDCGDVINPETVVAQAESAIIFGLSAALYGEITIAGGRAKQGNFDDYPIVRIDAAPEIETHIVTSGDALGGIGEPGLPPLAPAVCNAIYALTGKRIRKLPIGKVT
jgi:isoquinoline 1-oxidoreductase beta subunit